MISRKPNQPDERTLTQFNGPDQDDNWSQAFDYCREGDCPVVVIVNDEVWKLFPSGKAWPLGKAA